MKKHNHNIYKLIVCASLLLITHHTSLISAQTLSLDSCLSLARRNNVDIRTSQMEIDKAQAVKNQVFTKYFPQASLNGLGYMAADPLIRVGISDVRSEDMRSLLEDLYELVSDDTDFKKEIDMMEYGLAVSALVAQPIYAGGRIVTGNKLAKLGVEAAQLQAEAKERDVIENIESTYYLVVGLQQKVATVSAALSLIDSLDRTVQAALANGLVTRTDALQIQLKRNEMLANQQQLTSGIRLAKRLLCCQIGIDYNESFNVDTLDVSMTRSLQKESRCLDISMSRSLSSPSPSRPETRLLQLSVDAEQLQRRLTLGEALPQLSLVGIAFYGNLVKQTPSANAAVLLSLSVPLTAWWETSHKLKQHDISIQEARIKQDYYNKMMSLEEEKAYSDMVDAALLIRSDSAALDLAQENYRLANLNYTAGANTINDVLQAQTLLLQAQNALTDRRITYLVARRRLSDLQK